MRKLTPAAEAFIAEVEAKQRKERADRALSDVRSVDFMRAVLGADEGDLKWLDQLVEGEIAIVDSSGAVLERAKPDADGVIDLRRWKP